VKFRRGVHNNSSVVHVLSQTEML